MNDITEQTFADKIANLTYQHYTKLPKKGKPQEKKEWTLLSSIVMSENLFSEKSNLKVIALATGTKCLGQSFLSNKGDMVCDSHAEILTRRAFMRYIFYQVQLVLKGMESSVLKTSKECVCELKPGIEFHFFISHPPCGDASIFPKSDCCNTVISNITHESQSSKRNANNYSQNISKKLKSNETIPDNINLSTLTDDQLVVESDDIVSEKILNNGDIFRTGAKCILSGVQDPKGAGVNYHVTSVLRTKPGRGDPTLCMSCSDKMAVWNICGLQGALGSHFLLKPIYWSSIIIGKCAFSKSALERAIIDRTSQISNLPDGYKRASPSIYQSELQFEYCKANMEKLNYKVVPCSAAIIWSDIPGKTVDVCVNGKRQGIVKKNLDKPSSWVQVCRRKLFEEFIAVASLVPEEKLSTDLRHVLHQQNMSYSDFKKAATTYEEAKKKILHIFNGWTKKPESLQNFFIH